MLKLAKNNQKSKSEEILNIIVGKSNNIVKPSAKNYRIYRRRFLVAKNIPFIQSENRLLNTLSYFFNQVKWILQTICTLYASVRLKY